MPEQRIVLMGKVIGAFGILGVIKVKLAVQNDTFIEHYKTILLSVNEQSWLEYKLEKCSIKNNVFYIKLANIASRDEAQKLVGSFVGVHRDEFPQLLLNEYYLTDLIGLVVSNHEQTLGVVSGFMETGPTTVMVIDTTNKKNILIPFVSVYVMQVDLTNKSILVDWGLDY